MNSYINIILTALITLFPVVNPVGTAFILNPFFVGLSKEDQRKIGKSVAIYAFSICFVTLILGQYILEAFGLSVPVVQLAGGIIISKMGWEFMSDDQEREKVKLPNVNTFTSLKNKIFYPITFPTTTGAGTISVLLTLTAHNKGTTYLHSLINISAILIAVLAISILIYVFYSNTSRLINYWGETEKNIVNKISAFLVFCVGLEIASNGLFNLIKTFNHSL